ncbi:MULTISPECIES: DUF1513 domain-containing protein [Falsihalocynthiibacter]|uniref:DUF1513 domain-containing protein n=1 Tax=Falsihalocynthiibacter TaxID=2854182 RepID=UPI003001A2BB
MASRRAFLGGLIATGLCPRPSWADAGSPTYLSAARFPNAGDHLVGLSGAGDILFKLPLPGRGHAAAAHPTRPEAVGFARRPGRFAFVLDCITGQVIANFNAPEGRHFYGHGTFSADGSTLYTTENDYEAGLGVIGVWDAQHGYVRLGEFASGGVGPHDMKLMPDGETLVIANGGIETHPDMGRTKLNLTTMRPNLNYVAPDGTQRDQIELPSELSRNSIRHLAVGPDGLVAFAMQWQGEAEQHPALLGLHTRGEDIRLLQAPESEHRELRGYVGSVAIAQDASKLAATSPIGGVVQIFDLANDTFSATYALPDVCGVSAGGAKFMFSSGTGKVGTFDDAKPVFLGDHPCAWDNHLVRI